MNANELADLLDFDAKTLSWKAFADAATMLRRQQAEIDDLKKFIVESKELDKKVFEDIKKSEEMWNKATKSILMKAQKNE